MAETAAPPPSLLWPMRADRRQGRLLGGRRTRRHPCCPPMNSLVGPAQSSRLWTTRATADIRLPPIVRCASRGEHALGTGADLPRDQGGGQARGDSDDLTRQEIWPVSHVSVVAP